MRAVISVTGKDNMGIIAKVSSLCAQHGANILDVSQTILEEYFVMIMLTDISKLDVGFTRFADVLDALAEENNLKIHAMHEDIFDSMHRV